jgi:methylaspartate mutase sigma subunit
VSDQPLDGVTVVSGVIGDDIHVVGVRLLDHALRAAGATVVSLGVLSPPEDFVDATMESAADAVLVSSSNGHAAIICEGLRDRFVEAGLADVILYIGGNLVVGGATGWENVEREFLDLGFDRVFRPRAGLDEVVEVLAGDVERARA